MPSAEESEGPTIWANLGLASSFLFWRSKKPRASYDISRLKDKTKDTHSVLCHLRDEGLEVDRVSSIKKIAEYYDAVKHKKGNLATPTGEQAPINTPEANGGTVSTAKLALHEGNVNASMGEDDCVSTKKESAALSAPRLTGNPLSVTDSADNIAQVDGGREESTKKYRPLKLRVTNLP